VIRKFFPLDKNYVLESAQLSLENSLLHYLVDYVKVDYLLRTNPLGIQDTMTEKIHNHPTGDFRHLHEFYFRLSGVFRFKYYQTNQLEFPFDGRDPFERYCSEWTAFFKKCVKEFSRHDNFVRSVLDLTVFYPAESPLLMVDNRMNAFLQQHFEVKIHPQKGIVRKMA
jgi:hypothetical protein